VAQKEGHQGGYAYLCSWEGEFCYNNGWGADYWESFNFSIRVELKTGNVTVRKYKNSLSQGFSNMVTGMIATS